ncbi:MAG: tetratricopeptide repeat protein [Candidatus Omnitrophica bacterium]|nr:tetratricopeptide repeat protein [Candidatus Omnitrophota bacterium]
MKKIPLFAAAFIIAGLVFSAAASAYWVWTPETKKFINPKYAVKDTPKEQFDWAMSLYEAKDYKRAAVEFEKLVKHYEYSEYASKAQYYAGLSYESMGKYYAAFQNYQKTVENFPHVENIDEIIEREYHIANRYMAKSSPKLLGTDILTSADRAVEVYKKVVENAPFGKYADLAQYNMGMALKREERYDEAIDAFQKVSEDFPASRLAEKARYEAAQCAFKASLKPAYDAAPTAKAIRTFEEFASANRDSELSKEAEKTVHRLKDRGAEKSFMTAQFYEKLKKYKGAMIYYQDIVDRFPDSSFAMTAQAKIDVLRGKTK